jgi:GNAT superfamily N-acetyltransferase
MGRLKAPILLTKNHVTLGFDCGIDSLNDWLICLALKNQFGGASRTYVVCDEDQVAGYYAIAAGSVARSAAPGQIRRNMPDPVPVLILGRLAVDRRYQGSGMGRGLLKDALVRSLNVSEQVGARALIVHALNEEAEAFYLKHGFVKGPLMADMLFLAICHPDRG